MEGKPFDRSLSNVLFLFSIIVIMMGQTIVCGDIVVDEGFHTDWRVEEAWFTPPSPRAGEVVSFEVSVGIVTLIDPLPQTVDVALYLDGDLYFIASLTFNQPLEVLSAEASWIAVEGEHSANWMIDPKGLYVDPDLENNHVSHFVSVEEPVQLTYDVSVSASGLPSPYYTAVFVDDLAVGVLCEDSTQTMTFSVDTSHEITVNEYINGSVGVRYYCYQPGWICYTSDEHMFTYNTECLLTIESEYDKVSGAEYYEKGEEVTISVSPSFPMSGFWGAIGGKIRFKQWTGDLEDSNPTVTIVIDEPKNVTASWEEDYTIPLIVVGSGLIIIILSGILFSRMRRKVTPTEAELPVLCAEVEAKFDDLKIRFKQELNNLKNNWDALRKIDGQEAKLKDQLSGSEGDVDRASKELQKVQREKTAWENTYETAKISGISSEEIDQTFNRLFKSYNKKMQQYGEKISKAEKGLEKAQRKMNHLQAEVESLSKEEEKLRREIDASTNRIDTQEKGIKEIIAKWPHCLECEEIRDLLKAKKNRLDEVETTLEKVKGEAENAKELEKLKNEHAELKQRIEKREERLNEIKEELKRLFSPHTEKPPGFDEAKSKGWMELVPGVGAYFIGNKGAEELIRHFETVGNNYQRLRDEFKELENTRDQDEEDLKNLERRIKNQEDRLTRADDARKELDEERVKLEENIDDLEKKYSQCIEKLKDCQSETDDLRRKLEDLIKEYERRLKGTEKLLDNVERQKRKVEELRGRFEKAMKDLEDVTTKLKDILKFLDLPMPEFSGLWDWGGSFSTTLGYAAEDVGKFTIPTDTIKLVGELYGLFQKFIDPREGGLLTSFILSRYGLEELETIREALNNVRLRKDGTNPIHKIVQDIQDARNALNEPIKTVNETTPRLKALKANGEKTIDEVKRELADLKEPETLADCQKIKDKLESYIEQLQRAIEDLQKCTQTLEQALKQATSLIYRLESDILTIANTASGLELYRKAFTKWRDVTPLGDITRFFTRLWPF